MTGRWRRCCASSLALLRRSLREGRIVVLPRLIIGELHKFPDLARFYKANVVDRGLGLIARLHRRGVESGEFRPQDSDAVARLVVAPGPADGDLARRCSRRTRPSRSTRRRCWTPTPRRCCAASRPIRGTAHDRRARRPAPRSRCDLRPTSRLAAGLCRGRVPAARRARSRLDRERGGRARRPGRRPAPGCSRWKPSSSARRCARPRPSCARAEAELADLRLGKRPEEIAQIEANLAEARAALAYAEQDLRPAGSCWPARDCGGPGAARPGALGGREARARVAAMEAAAGDRPPARRGPTRSPPPRPRSRMREAALAQARWQLDQRTVRAPGRRPGRGSRARGRASGSVPAGPWSACCRRERSRCASSCRSRSWARIRVGQRVALRCDGCADGDDRHRPLHRAARPSSRRR